MSRRFGLVIGTVEEKSIVWMASLHEMPMTVSVPSVPTRVTGGQSGYR